jgi:hypothetical protein
MLRNGRPTQASVTVVVNNEDIIYNYRRIYKIGSYQSQVLINHDKYDMYNQKRTPLALQYSVIFTSLLPATFCSRLLP